MKLLTEEQAMTWLMLAVGFFLLLSGILSQAYSLKTKRGVLPPKTRIWRVLTRLAAVSCRPAVDGHGGRPDRSPPWTRSALSSVHLKRGTKRAYKRTSSQECPSRTAK